MKFTALKVSYSDYPERLNRLIAIRPNADLGIVCYAIGNSLNAEFEHIYKIIDGKTHYVRRDLLNNLPFGYENEYRNMRDYTLEDLSNNFKYLYDMGEGYEFDCEILKEPIEVELEDDDQLDPLQARTISGKGLGIFEDGKMALDDYFSGEIKPNRKTGPNEWDVLPWHLDMKKFGDYEKDLCYPTFDVFDSELDFLDYEEEDFNMFGDIPDDMFYPSDDDKISPEVLEKFLREQAARDIFEDMDINRKYRELILKYDINEAYEMIVRCLIDAHNLAEEDGISEDEVDEVYYEMVDELS